MEHPDITRDRRRGAFYGLLAAALFGLSAPLAKRLLGEMSAPILAGMLYLGAGIGLSAWLTIRPTTKEAPVQRQDLPALAGVVIFGGILGPLLMLIGLQRVSAVAGSLLLNLEGPFTMAVAVVVFREHLGKFGVAAAAFIFSGAALLGFQNGDLELDVWGMLAIAGACLAWAFDNNITQSLSLRDPFAIVRIKALGAGAFNLALGLLLGNALPALHLLGLVLLLGVLSYGASIVLDTYALRLVGAAREAAYFASAPFVGALSAPFILGESLSLLDGAAMAFMAAGVAALLLERHSHWHQHEKLEHDHVHVHDAHHRHEHSHIDRSAAPHSHQHTHEPLAHSHSHLPDAHHRHRH